MRARRWVGMAKELSPQSPALMAPVVSLMCWPLLAAQFWLGMVGAVVQDRGKETDAGDTGGQLPVPDALQDTMDSELFA